MQAITLSRLSVHFSVVDLIGEVGSSNAGAGDFVQGLPSIVSLHSGAS